MAPKSRSAHKREFNEAMREAARDKRVLLEDPVKWEIRSEHAHWVLLLRETAPIYQVHEKIREAVVHEVLKGLEAAIGEAPTVLSCDFGHNVALLYQKSDALCVIGIEGLTLYSSSIDVIDRVAEAKVVPKISQAKTVNLLSTGDHGIRISYAGHIDRPLHELNYAPEVTEQIRAVINWAEAADPYGRITIFAGPPGTGKSFAVRALVTETEHVEWVLVPPHLVSRLASPDMVKVLLDERNDEGPLGLIVEDADSLLRERAGGGDENVVSQLLNLGDGFTGDLADIRLLMTTNVAKLQIDKALLRQGRLFKFVQFEKLGTDQVAALFKELTGEERAFSAPMALSDVYGLANDHKTHTKEPNTESFGQYV